MYTTYDLQSNGFLSNRMYQLKDGSVAVTANFSYEEYDASFLDRGTGYNFAAGGDMDSWLEMPEQRIEDIRTGWPTIAPYGAEGEILVNHAEGLNYWIREKAGEGEWDGPHAIPNPDPAKLEGIEAGLSLAWPRVVTSGENNEVVHIFAAATGSEGYHQFYVRSTDLQNWDVQFAPLAIDGYHTGFYAADDCAASSNGKDIAVVYCTGFMSHVMLYESNDEGLTWKSRMVWESPIHGLDWTTDENSLIEKLYGPTHASVAIGNDGVSHVVLGVGLYDRPELSNSYMIYAGLMTDGIAYWNDTTAWEYEIKGKDTIPVLSPIRSPRDYDLRHALRLWWEDESGEYIQMDLTNFCAWMPPHAEEGYNAFDHTYQYTGSDAGTAGDYMALFGLSAYPSIAVDPVGNLAVAWSAPDLNRDLYNSVYYMRSIFVKYKPADVAYWWNIDNHGMSLYEDFIHIGDEATFISAVSNSVNPNEFWFSCLSDDTPGFYTGSVTSQPTLTTSTVNVFKYTPSENYIPTSCVIKASVNPENTGKITGTGVYNYNETVTLTATANTGYRFGNWTENGSVVSTEAVYSFAAMRDRNLVANFEIAPINNYLTPDPSLYANDMSLIGLIQINGVNQNTTALEVGAFCDEELRGSRMAQYIPALDKYLVFLTIYGENDDEISFKLYDHRTQQETDLTSPEPLTFTINGTIGNTEFPHILNFRDMISINAYANPADAGNVSGNDIYLYGTTATLSTTPNPGFVFKYWTANGMVVSYDLEFSFVVTEAGEFVANYEYIQSDTLSSGWNWYSSYIEIDGKDGLRMIEEALGENGVQIKDHIEFVVYSEGGWYGSLLAVSPEKMYMIETSTPHTFNLVGNRINTEELPISIGTNWNWISYPVNTEMAVEDALATILPQTGDYIKSQTEFSQYYEGAGWLGALNTMIPGEGYMYHNASGENKTLVYPSAPSTRSTKENVTAKNNYWVPNTGKYPANMSLIAVVENNGIEMSDYEVAAFVGDEIRGSARPIYIEALDRHMIFMTVYGDSNERIEFKYYDVNADAVENATSRENITFSVNAIYGSVDNAIVLTCGTLSIGENGMENINVYPNPVNNKLVIETEYEIEKIVVYNVYGQQTTVNEQQSLFLDMSSLSSGIYFIKIYTDNGNFIKRIIKQ